MKYLLILASLFATANFKATAQDTIKLSEAPAHIGQNVTFLSQVSDFDSRTDYIYLHFGGHYPNQVLTVIVKRTNGKKPIKLNRDIILGREMVYFTGTLITYTGGPDTTGNYDIPAIKRDIETDKPFIIGGQPMTAHFSYDPRTIPIDLKGKSVMIITGQEQIGRKMYHAKLSLY